MKSHFLLSAALSLAFAWSYDIARQADAVFAADVAPAAKAPAATAPAAETPQPETPAELQVLDIPGASTGEIDYAALPVLKGERIIVGPPDPVNKFQLHNYLIHHDGRFWCMWSHGPPVEDEPGQLVRYAVSDDGATWSEPQVLAGPPAEGYAYIARGFWLRNGELLALVAHFKGKGAFGVNKELQLQVLAWNAARPSWEPRGTAFDNAINNFAPQRLPSGPWMMTRRDSRFNVSMLIGGESDIDAWEAYPVVQRLQVPGFNPDEPIWWAQPDGTLVGLFRDNAGSQRLYHAVSSDEGRTWSLPRRTNFPNASSKIYSLRLNDGPRVLLSNSQPMVGRRQMHLSLSDDGQRFTRMAVLDIPQPRASTLQYPHAIEHDGHLWIAFSRTKAAIEIFKVSLDDIRALQAGN